MDHETHERFKQLEERVQYLEALISTPLALTETLSFSGAEQLLLQQLPIVEEKDGGAEGGGVPNSDHSPPVTATEGGDPTTPGVSTSSTNPPEGDTFNKLVESGRAITSARAATVMPRQLSRNFRPSEFGYTTDDFARDYPDVNPTEVLESFFNHHLARQTKSKNWLELFWGYAQRANSFEMEKKMSNPNPTDSMGLPLDRQARRRMLGQD